MTIEEAIEQLADLRKDRESFAKNGEPDGVFAQDIKAIDIAVKALEENDTLKTEIMAVKSGSDVLKICKLEEENKELKKLLKLAVEDIRKHSFCSMCENFNDNSKCKKCKAITLDNFKWKHAEEALKLIGDD